MSYWMQTSTGAAIDLTQPDPESIRLMDIAIMLSRLPRFTGGTKPYMMVNVAEHSLFVEQLAPADTAPVTRLHLLFHDAHEITTGDISSPMKRVLRELAGWVDVVKMVSETIQRAIELAANLPEPTEVEYGLIRELDLLSLAIEKRDCMSPEPMDWNIWNMPDVSQYPLRMVPKGRARAAVQFRRRTLELLCEANIVPRRSFLEGI